MTHSKTWIISIISLISATILIIIALVTLNIILVNFAILCIIIRELCTHILLGRIFNRISRAKRHLTDILERAIPNIDNFVYGLEDRIDSLSDELGELQEKLKNK